jgi:hypothetical protein
VTNYSNGNGPGNVAIYKGAMGSPTYYTDSDISQMFLCGYDNKNNLFVDGVTSSSAFAFAELPSGSASFANITLNQFINEPGGGVQWDGKHMAVGDSTVDTIYQFTISGTNGTEVSSTPLNDAFSVGQFWIQGPNVIGPYIPDVGIWSYPTGGSATKTIHGGSFNEPFGSTISEVKI